MSVFTEVRRTRYPRRCCQCSTTVRTSDPVVSVRVSPWAYGPSTGAWQVLEFCDDCGRHHAAVA